MKIMSIFFALVLSIGLTAQTDKTAYVKVMETNIQAMKDGNSIEDLQSVANTFSRISEMNKEQWLPAYYTGFTYVIMSFESGLTDDERDAYLDIAEKFADQADEISEDNSEVVTLQGYVKMAKVSIKPATRGPFMTSSVMKLFSTAMELDTKNPRAMLMMGRMKYGTAQFFRSSTDDACALINGSLQLYAQEKDRGILPHWGEGMAKQLSKRCNSTTQE